MKKYVIKKRAPGPGENLLNQQNHPDQLPDHPKHSKHYLIDYKNELNPQQYQAATALNGPYLVIAGAGSGKTRTLIYRVAYLVENDISPSAILLLTFTRKAAQEMMHRASTILDDRCRRVAGGTFHSFANTILRNYALYINMLPNFTILDRADSEDIINIIRSRLELNKKEHRFPRKNTIANIISRAVNKCIDIEAVVMAEYPQFAEQCDQIIKVTELYHQYKKEKQILDYDDLLVKLLELLKTSNEVREKLSANYQYIMVDEYQDTNRLQAEIAVYLASGHQNIMAVGDDSQSIYSFRGAHFQNIMDFPRLFPGTQIITLEQNYRSIRPILDLTNAIIQQAKEKYSKVLFSQIEGDQKPVFLVTIDEQEQAAFIAQRVLALREEGIPLKEIAVLFRASWHANALEIELKHAGIPYRKYGGLKFSESAHVKDILAYMRILHNIFDEIAWLRLLLLIHGIGPVSAQKITTKIIRNGGNLQELIAPDFAKSLYYNNLKKLYALLARLYGSNLRPAEKLEAVIDYYIPIFEETYDDFRRRREDLNSLLRITERYTDLEHMLTDLALEPPETSQVDAEKTDKEDEYMVLSTIHSAKGLEWHTVFVIHLVEGYFPGIQSVDSEEDIEEERRLFYVATTRAKKNLFLLAPELEARSARWSGFDSLAMAFSLKSRFISEIPDFENLAEVGVLEFAEDDPF